MKKRWLVCYYFLVVLALLGYIVYDYRQLDEMSERKAWLYAGASLAAIIFMSLPFVKKFAIHNLFTVIPSLFFKIEQNGQEISEVREIAERADGTAEQANEKAKEALDIALQAKKTVEDNKVEFRPMTSEEVSEMINQVFST